MYIRIRERFGSSLCSGSGQATGCLGSTDRPGNKKPRHPRDGRDQGKQSTLCKQSSAPLTPTRLPYSAEVLPVDYAPWRYRQGIVYHGSSCHVNTKSDKLLKS